MTEKVRLVYWIQNKVVNIYFTGRELDLLDWDEQTGPRLQRMHYRHRDYSPEMGRFVQHDPLEYVDGLNTYEYVVSNPVVIYDPMGLACGPGGLGDWFVPDKQYIIPNPLGNADFRPACQNHDDCYGGAGAGGCETSKEECDKNLYKDMKQACKEEYPPWKRILLPVTNIHYADCLAKAEIYYQAVKLLGQRSFDKARKNNPNCPQCGKDDEYKDFPIIHPTLPGW